MKGITVISRELSKMQGKEKYKLGTQRREQGSRGELRLTETFRIVDEVVNNCKDITVIYMAKLHQWYISFKTN